MKHEQQLDILRAHGIPVPLKAERLIGKTLVGVVRDRILPEPVLIFSDNYAFVAKRHYIYDDTVAVEDVQDKSECDACDFGLDVMGYLGDLIYSTADEALQKRAEDAQEDLGNQLDIERKAVGELQERKAYERLKAKYG